VKVSIITVVYNNHKTIKEAITSVQTQLHNNVEHIIIDGGSTDGTVEIIRKSIDKNTVFVSEKDNGLYDALNKGIRLATGDVIGILHSDDIFNSTNVLSDVVNAFNANQVDSVYADLVYVNRQKSEKVLRNWISGEFSKRKFLLGWMPPHPTFFVKKEIFRKFGLYDTDFKSAADYELMLRLLYKNNISTHYIPKTMVRMRLGGESNKSIRNRLKANQEDYKAWQKNNLSPSAYLRILKPLIKLPQFVTLPNFKRVAINSWN
jgi:glycosyltransferase involved in cell wall biosynthesis